MPKAVFTTWIIMKGVSARSSDHFPAIHAQWREAVEAYERFGRGHHSAKLNFRDCLSYATAKLAGQPLLYVGEDFSKTDPVSHAT